jgi:hypothetical protein
LLFARAEWRARWRSYLVIGLLVAATVVASISTAAAAARSQTAFDRLRAATNASDIAVWPEDGSLEQAASELRTVEGVTGVRPMHLLFVRPAGTDLFPDYTLFPVAPGAAGGSDPLDQPVIVEGRAPDPSLANEIALSEGLARDLGVGVGDGVGLESMTTEFVDEQFERESDFEAPPDGPRIDATVTGLARSPAEFGVRPNVIHLTPAFVDAYEGRIRRYDFVHASLTPELLALGMREGGLDLGVGDAEVELSMFSDSGSTGDGLSTIAHTLRIVGAVAALAGLLAVALAFLRGARASAEDRRTLSALGWAKADQLRALTLTFAPWVVAGTALGVVAGVLLSPEATVGLAEAIDPEPSAVILSRQLALVVVCVSVLLLALALGVALWLAVSRRPVRASTRPRGNPIGRPLPLAIGVRHALFGRADLGGRASRAALVATTLGVTAALAAFVVSASITRLETDGALFGNGPGRSVDSGESTEQLDRALPILEADERVSRILLLHTTFGISAPDNSGFTTVAFDTRRGEPVASLLAGRLPSAADEVAMGPRTLDDLDRGIGDEVELHSDRGSERYRIVGEMLFPEGEFSHDEGAAMTVVGAERLIGDPHDNAQIHGIEFDWAEGVDAAAADQELVDRGLPIYTSQTALLPATVTNLAQVADLPRYLAGFVALLCLATLVHATWVSVSLGARERATLQAIGTTRRCNVGIVSTHALVLVAIAVAVGLPLGIALGRQVWQPIAERANVVVLAVVPWGSFLGAAVAAVIAGLVLASIAGIRVARLRPAVGLRAE